MCIQKCLICKEKNATKTNSHIIPSFLVAKICSYDNSGQRDKDIIFSIDDTSVNLFIGQLPSTKIEELLDYENLTDERIEELKKNPVALNFIFCPECEKKLADYIEAPYAKFIKESKKISPDVSYMFWMSIAYRLSITQNLGFRLPYEIEYKLGDTLNKYIEARKNGNNFEDIIRNCGVSYKILYSPQFLQDNSGGMYAEYSDEHKILTVILGDIIVTFNFNKDFPKKYRFKGIESAIRRSPQNNGFENEKYKELSIKALNAIYLQLKNKVVKQKTEFYKNFTNIIWKEIGLPGEMPDNMFKFFLSSLSSEDTKLGERHTIQNMYDVFIKTLDFFGYKPKNK